MDGENMNVNRIYIDIGLRPLVCPTSLTISGGSRNEVSFESTIYSLLQGSGTHQLSLAALMAGLEGIVKGAHYL